ncbi:hypothetical protein BH11PSE3_BH11PSE3_18840 [soil metagenome]
MPRGNHERASDGIISMTDSAGKALTQRIKDLEAAAQKARLEAMQLAATLLTKETRLLAGPGGNDDPSGSHAVLRARYDMLVRVADDAQSQIDKLHAEQHDAKYYR